MAALGLMLITSPPLDNKIIIILYTYSATSAREFFTAEIWQCGEVLYSGKMRGIINHYGPEGAEHKKREVYPP
jgi:hypothetical protein